ncbi:MAG: hypothetical protein OIN87_04095 [Candidatus Methanoperedens sp.]|nr:hypothetical protein [Candidatus Methanoperedens sp.]
MDITGQFIIAKFLESYIFISYLFFFFLSIQTIILWNNVDKEKKQLIVTDSFVQRNCMYASFLSVIIILFGFFEYMIHIDTYFGLFNLLVPGVLVLFSFEWYSRLKPYVSKLLPVELTDFNSLSKGN